MSSTSVPRFSLSDRVRNFISLSSSSLHISGAAQCRRGVSYVDGCDLTPFGPNFLDIGYGGADSAEDRGAGFANLEFCRKYRIGPGNYYLGRIGHAFAADTHNLFECANHR